MGLRGIVAENIRYFTWKYFVLLALWEGIALSLVIGLARTGEPVTPTYAWWSFFWCALPLVPVVVPLSTQAKVASAIAALLVALVVMASAWMLGAWVAIWIAPESEWAYEWRYAYSLDSEDTYLAGAEIHIVRKPHDCEFMTSPLGAKHCHYEREIHTVRVRRDDSGRFFYSYDDSKIWQLSKDPLVPAVFVSWRKVEE